MEFILYPLELEEELIQFIEKKYPEYIIGEIPEDLEDNFLNFKEYQHIRPLFNLIMTQEILKEFSREMFHIEILRKIIFDMKAYHSLLFLSL